MESKIFDKVTAKAIKKIDEIIKAAEKNEKEKALKLGAEYFEFTERVSKITGKDQKNIEKKFQRAWEKEQLRKREEVKRNGKN